MQLEKIKAQDIKFAKSFEFIHPLTKPVIVGCIGQFE